MEDIPVPVLRLDNIENDGCPFEGYEKKSTREAKRKVTKKLRGGCCEICDEKFSDEETHVKSKKHCSFLSKRLGDFNKLQHSCDNLFPDGFDGFLRYVLLGPENFCVGGISQKFCVGGLKSRGGHPWI